MKIHCFGNPYVEEDSLALELADELEIEGLEFIKCDGPDFLMDYEGDLIILDVAKGIEKVELIDDPNKLSSNNMVSLHDFDLQFFLKLLHELGKLGKLSIVAVPCYYDKELAKKEVSLILKSL